MSSIIDEYDELDGLALAKLVAEKAVSPSELVETATARIEADNPRLNAIIHRLYERALEQAKGPLPEGAFRGVPFLLKDLSSQLAGVPTTHGSVFYGDWAPAQNSELVNRYLAAGVIVMGKTNTPEFGLIPSTEPKRFGPTRNPWDIERTAGGSSGGAAAAVAARMVPLAGGGDGGGSIRIPASCCGLFGMKPSRGRTPVGPMDTSAWHGCAIEHVLTRSVRDSAAMLDAVSGPLLGDLFNLPKSEVSFLDATKSDPRPLRIAASAEPLLPGTLDPVCREAFDDAVKLLESLGHEVVQARPPIKSVEFARHYLVMLAGQTWSTLESAQENTGRKLRRDQFEEKTWLGRVMGEAFTAGDYVHHTNKLFQMGREVHRFMAGFDVLLTPTLALPPQPLGFLRTEGTQAALEWAVTRLPIPKSLFKGAGTLDRAGADAFAFIPYTPVFNVTGQPSMTVPLYWSKEDLPIGSMFTASLGDEATLFQLAGQLERARPWNERRPSRG